jgi:hypothetical protein
MVLLLKEQATTAIIQDWNKLPQAERQTVNQAWSFAERISDRYHWRGDAGNKAKKTAGMIVEYHIRKGVPLRHL